MDGEKNYYSDNEGGRYSINIFGKIIDIVKHDIDLIDGKKELKPRVIKNIVNDDVINFYDGYSKIHAEILFEELEKDINFMTKIKESIKDYREINEDQLFIDNFTSISHKLKKISEKFPESYRKCSAGNDSKFPFGNYKLKYKRGIYSYLDSIKELISKKQDKESILVMLTEILTYTAVINELLKGGFFGITNNLITDMKNIDEKYTADKNAGDQHDEKHEVVEKYLIEHNINIEDYVYSRLFLRSQFLFTYSFIRDIEHSFIENYVKDNNIIKTYKLKFSDKISFSSRLEAIKKRIDYRDKIIVSSFNIDYSNNNNSDIYAILGEQSNYLHFSENEGELKKIYSLLCQEKYKFSYKLKEFNILNLVSYKNNKNTDGFYKKISEISISKSDGGNNFDKFQFQLTWENQNIFHVNIDKNIDKDFILGIYYITRSYTNRDFKILFKYKNNDVSISFNINKIFKNFLLKYETFKKIALDKFSNSSGNLYFTRIEYRKFLIIKKYKNFLSGVYTICNIEKINPYKYFKYIIFWNNSDKKLFNISVVFSDFNFYQDKIKDKNTKENVESKITATIISANPVLVSTKIKNFDLNEDQKIKLKYFIFQNKDIPNIADEKVKKYVQKVKNTNNNNLNNFNENNYNTMKLPNDTDDLGYILDKFM